MTKIIGAEENNPKTQEDTELFVDKFQSNHRKLNLI